MDVIDLQIPDVKLFVPKISIDERGWFFESYSHRIMRVGDTHPIFVQDNHSLSRNVGTVRGLHFQIAPHAQGKLVRVVRGSVLDVAVDVRLGSPTFGQHVAAELSAENRRQIWVPIGFAHGFCTLEADTEVVYKVTDYYVPECDSGIKWNDPDLGICWPIGADNAVLSEKDANLPALRDSAPAFNLG